MTTIFKDSVIFETLGETIAAGQPLYKSTGTGADSGRTAGRLYLLDVTNSDRRVFYGIAKDAGIAADQNKRVINAGRAEGFTGLTAGLPVYAGATAGSYTQVPPTSNIQVLGVAQDADTLLVNAALAGSFLSSTGGVGVSDLYVLFQDDFETSILADYTQTGLTLSAASPLHGAISALLTSHVSINQSFGRTYTVPEEFRNKNLTIKLNIKSAATAGNVTINVYDVTNSADIVASQALELSSAIGGVLTSVSFDVPETCASLRYTITALPEAGSPATRVDDITCEITSVAEYSAVVQETDSMVRVDTSNGFGSTGTVIRRFTNLRESIGSDILYQDSAVSGASFTALVSGTYDISFTEVASAVTVCGLTKNAPSLSTGITSTAIQFVLASDVISANAYSASVAWQGYLQAGDVVRAHTNGVSAATNGTITSQFTMSRQGSLKVASVNSDQKITIPTSELRFEGASSRGAVATAIVKFDTMAKIRGDAFSVVSDAVNGTAITMLKAGRLNIGTSLTSGSACRFDITKNQSTLTAVSTTPSEILASEDLDGGTSRGSAFWSGDVNIGDVLRVDMSVAPSANATNNLNLSFQEQEIQVSVTNILPTFSESDSSVRVDTGNGYGSTANKIRRFSNVRDNIGTDVTYADSATAGSSFTAKVSGTYEISYSDIFSGAGFFGLSKNASSLTTGLSSLAATERLVGATAAAGSGDNVSWQGYLVQGDIVRPHTDGGTPGGETLVNFTMSKVGKPNVTGVNVTPFVNVPQPVSQSIELNNGSATSAIITNYTVGKNTNTGVISHSAGVFTALKRCLVVVSVSGNQSGAGVTGVRVLKGANILALQNVDVNSYAASVSASTELEVGETIHTFAEGAIATARCFLTAEALSDQILTAPETFSTDTAALTYAGSGTYTLATLANAPVGTFITFTYAINTNTRTQTNSAPTQTTADMNANGMLIYTRAYNAASTAAQPAVIAIQIGKGLKGVTRDVYKSSGKVLSGELQSIAYASTADAGLFANSYNEVTGVLFLDGGLTWSASVTNHALFYSDGSSQTSGYLVINASKSPALTGFGLNRIAARGVNTAGTSIPNNTVTTVVFDATKTFDTHGALNAATGVFTAPDTGYYQVSGGVLFVSAAWTSGQVADLYIYKNGSVITNGKRDTAASISAPYGATVSDLVYLNKNDTVNLSVYQTRGSASTLITNVGWNYFSVTKTSV